MEEKPQIEIRPIEPEEYEIAAELVKACLGEYDAYDSDPQLGDLQPERMEDLYEEPKGRFWVAVAEGAVIGTAAMRRVDDRTCQLRRVAVHADFRGPDIPQQMIGAFEEYARAAGYRKVVASISVRQKPAATLLTSLGYLEYKRTLRDRAVYVTFEKAL